jgi:phosphate transport system protein
MREVFHQSLEDLQSRLVEIADLVTVSIDKATRAFASSPWPATSASSCSPCV